jgi:catechol 2,3-dioxygenase-like lactoylglutathione lyase family enzyme
LASPISGVDFVAIPATDGKRLHEFYVGTLGLRPDEHSEMEFWAGNTCFSIWETAKFGVEFAPQRNGNIAFHVDDLAGARASLEAKGIEFRGETMDSSVCHMAFFRDPDGNDLMLHSRYAPHSQ